MTLERPLQRRLWACVVLLAIISLAAAFRAYRLSGMLPILVDESIYLRWAEIIDHQHTWFISLLDGKQPLSYWLLTWMRRIGPADPLMGGRIISAIAGVLSTGMLFFLAYRLGGAALGAFAALLCALLPYGVLYEHIAYTDALVSFFAILTAWAALECFRAEEYRWAMTLLAGSCLALAALIKTTALQFAGFPVFVGLVHRRRKLRDLGLRLALMAGMVALPLALVWHARPQGPRFAEISPVLHRTDFFASPANFGAVAYNARINLGLMASYLVHYVTLPVLLAAAAGLFALVKQRQWTTLAVIAAGLVPLPFQMLLLKYFPGRYIFPHAWCLLLAASALVVLTGRAGLCIGVLLIVPLALRSWNLVNYPSFVLHETDANEFLGSGPYSGFGAREAAMFLRQESESGPFVVLTDPFWGPPADVMFVYLQGRNGVRVYEAWWLQASVGPYPILPVGVTPVWKSQYQRIEAAEVNFDDCPRVYYVTDTNYRVPTDVLAREPAARLVARFLKQNGKDSIDVYRLR